MLLSPEDKTGRTARIGCGDLAGFLMVISMSVAAALAPAAETPSGQPTAESETPRADGPVKRALLIGVDDYAFVADLQYCGRDIEAMRGRLIVAGFRDEHVTLLRDGAEQSRLQPFQLNIQRELDALLDAAGPEDLVLIAFSGHGVHLDGTSYFCPIEAQLEQPETTLISLASVYQRLEASSARQKLLVVDACRNDPRRPGTKGIEEPTEALDGFSRTLETPPESILVLSSCKPGEVSFEEDELRHGVFMNFLLRGLEGEADRARDGNADGQVSLLELYNYASLQTKTHVARTRSRVQTPVLYGKLTGDFPVAAALPSQPDELPSRFRRMSRQGVDHLLFTDPGVMSAKEPQTLLALRRAHQLLLPGPLYGAQDGIPLNDCNEGLTAVNEAISLEPTNAFAYLLRGIGLRKRGDYAAALADFNRLNLAMELSVAGAMSFSEADLKIDDRVVAKVEGMERLTVTQVAGDLVWVESVAPYASVRAVDDSRQGWLDAKFLKSEILERTAETNWYTTNRATEALAERTIGREQIAPVDASDPHALAALEQARSLLGETRAGGMVYLRRNVEPDDLDRVIGLCAEVFESEPDNRSALLLRGLVHREKKDYAAGLEDFRQADEPFTVVVAKRAVELKQPQKPAVTARLGDRLTITQTNDKWLWAAAVNGDKERCGWVDKNILDQPETFTTQAFRTSTGTATRTLPGTGTIRNEALRRARGYIPYGGWLPF